MQSLKGSKKNVPFSKIALDRSERIIPRQGVVSPAVLRLRLFLMHKQYVSPSVVSTLRRLNRWAESIQDGRSESVLPRTLAGATKASDLIEQIAEDLTKHTTGIERQLLSKSIQETLFYSVGFRANLTASQIKTRLRQFLDRQGRACLTQRVLSLFFL